MTTEDHTRGPVPCDQVGMFVDGALDPEQAEAFRQHLVQCARCQSEMHALMQLAGLAEEASRASVPVAGKVTVPPAYMLRKRISRGAFAGGAVLAALVVGVVMLKQRRATEDVPTLLASLDVRSVSGWPSGLGVATYHGYDTVRGLTPSSTPATARLSSAELRAEQVEDWRTAGTLALLRRDFGRADGFLARLPPRPDVLADRGLIRLEQGSCDEALEYLDRALRAEPGFAPARFNRGLCLRRLDLGAAASSTFEAVASANLGGWSAESKAQVDDLRRGLLRRSEAEQAFKASSPDSLEHQAPIPPDLVIQYPGRARDLFYRMLVLAPSITELRRLLPVAQGLDKDFGTSALEAQTRAAIAQVRPERAAIARELARFYRAYPDDVAKVDALLARALRARQDDQALQLYNDFKELTVTPDRVRLTRLGDDPYARVWLAAATAYQQRGAGRILDAEQTLRESKESCKDESLAFPCWYLDIQRTAVERALSRFDSAARIAQASARKMRALGIRGAERNARLEAAEVLLAAGKVAAARGSYEDIGLREPNLCQVTVYRAERLAAGYVRRGDVVGARDALAGLPDCPAAPMEPRRLELRLELALLEGKRDALAQVIETARVYTAQPDTTKEDQALADVYAARAATELDRPGASTELAAALRRLEGFGTDADTRQVRARGWAALALAELRRGDGPAALGALSSQLGLEASGRCAVGLVADGTRQGWITVDGSGATSQRLAPVSPEMTVPPLAGCPSVAVLVSGWEHVERALSPDVAWTVRIAQAKSGETTARGEQLLVRDVRPPADLQLPPLGLQSARTPGDWNLLEGAEATPERVLRALRRASYAEFEVHGLIDAQLPDGAFLALSEDAERRYALSARELEGQTFTTRPIVMLGACRAAAGSTLRDEAWTLPRAFLSAGARGVFAARVELPDAEVGTFFSGIRERLDRGEQPSAALRDEKLAWLSRGRTWVRDVLLFD